MNVYGEYIGLKKKEAALYEALLPLGDVPLSDAIQAMREHPQAVYRLVDSLAAKGLAIVSTKRHRKYVRAEDPRALERLQLERLEDLRADLPRLLALQAKQSGTTVRLLRGDEAVRALRVRGYGEVAKGGSYDVIGGSGDRFYEAMGGRYEAIEKARLKRGVKRRIVTFESQRRAFARRETVTGLTEMRFLPDDFPIPSSTNIFNDTTALIVWDAEPIIVEIESAAVAKAHRQTFQALWRMAKP
jgi:sugar-specific transcriptional regulator TrmB